MDPAGQPSGLAMCATSLPMPVASTPSKRAGSGQSRSSTATSRLARRRARRARRGCRHRTRYGRQSFGRRRPIRSRFRRWRCRRPPCRARCRAVPVMGHIGVICRLAMANDLGRSAPGSHCVGLSYRPVLGRYEISSPPKTSDGVCCTIVSCPGRPTNIISEPSRCGTIFATFERLINSGSPFGANVHFLHLAINSSAR